MNTYTEAEWVDAAWAAAERDEERGFSFAPLAAPGFDAPPVGRSCPFPFDLQLFAAEDEGRTEEPTEYKKRKAREEGKVAKTPELPAALVLLFGFFLVFIIFDFLAKNSIKMMEYYLRLVPDIVNGGTNVMFLFKPMVPILLKLLGPVLAVTLLAAFLGNVVQVGFLFSTKPIEPDFSKINPNPIRFFTRNVFSRQGLMNLGKSIFKIAAIGTVSYLLVRKDLAALMRTLDMSVVQAFSIGLIMTFKLVMVVTGIFLFLSIPDYFFQRFEHLESLKMTRQEVKEEQKLLIGDPLLRARIREKQREFARRRMLHEVPKADVVITNPIHFAVALKYEALKMSAPRCVAKGQDLIAQRIRQIAEENDVALVENKPLARELYKRVEIGDEVPEDLFTAVAEVLAFVYRLKRKEAVNV
jgi:flagellar biosynthetic protein FlhB